jgi:hypothetical protein
VRRPIAAAACTVSALATLGCGRDRIRPPDTVRPEPPAGVVSEAYPDVGLFFDRPGNWPFRRGRPPQVAGASSGTATVALWRYLRSEPLPRAQGPLNDAQDALVDAVKARDPTFVLERGTNVEVDGAPAIELLGTQTVDGQQRRVRSVHAYAKGAEVVVDAYAPPEEFARVDRDVFRPLIESLRIDPPEG